MALITTKWITKLNTVMATAQVNKAIAGGLVDAVAAITEDAITLSPHVTGNNRRSIKFEVGPGAPIAKKEGEAAVYSTSGYGGYLETGTVKMAAQPYMKPALDKNMGKLPAGIKARLE